MGRVYLEHMGGQKLFNCGRCGTFLTNRNELMSTRFTGATGRAFLFTKVVNLKYSEVQDRVMLTGRHMVRDVFCKNCGSKLGWIEVQDRVMLTGRHIVRDVACKNCNIKLGWIYEFATEDNQRYKEGRVILERALVQEQEGFEEQ
ncbi:hypothetical protein TCAL_05973 [Tigriopus californicus]|uniref:Yippee domain-containing protein n=1 Tax=Tigriopus californicus TaxID=6832 RepID=A0A553NNL1_TIGCA|nr:hypothetical protein TCAL_05973 [Tigriopus californicus]